ncbi:hypothetical protein [Catellatospora vulcania]|uniref:hypothetical protein n=1 Tax=Catellatospora vulcania TaxID=1460450 RepID=UPI0012D3F1D9|nr:hypothetical protein [Catellatospora vulcania]
MTARPAGYAEVARLYAEQCEAPFPDGVRGADCAGVDLVMLDADTAGCVHTWLSNGGALDAWRRDVLSRRLEHLEQVVPRLSGSPAGDYYAAWRRLALLVRDS